MSNAEQMPYLCISAYEVVAVEKLPDQTHVSERSIWGGGNLMRAKQKAREYTEQTHFSAYVTGAEGVLFKYEWDPRGGVTEIPKNAVKTSFEE